MARVLVVDDDLQYRRVVRIALTVRGYDVREAANGFEALDEMRLAAVDVILMDWLMPPIDGEAACRAIRASSSVPIIVVDRNVFPAMKITWGTYRNNIGHNDFPGCFRCRDDTHSSVGGKVVTQH